MGEYRYVVFTAPKEGQEREYDDFYSNRHVPDVLKVPGIRRAQRYKLSKDQRVAGDLPFRHLCVYDVVTDDLGKVIDEIRKRIGTPIMPRNPHMAEDRFVAFWEPAEPTRESVPESEKHFLSDDELEKVKRAS